MKREPLTITFEVREEEDRCVFALIERSGEQFVLIPSVEFEVIPSEGGANIILRRKPFNG